MGRMELFCQKIGHGPYHARARSPHMTRAMLQVQSQGRNPGIVSDGKHGSFGKDHWLLD